ncbi:hypothetical protein CROQUDRAFT_71115 [Cronartium quercuum f. sp. fusiforme G11]|uniref:Chromatin assembly factor 1 subunit A n=1 Tax=Cronartium quercuum f. sp. fusiforme G11 TaxID=708437 RepID=A0A9P6TGZ3_9BASI|nr:hypothetical protein CROQUDRAFT_71115 [Cronartium quercuum f. sp. fusiforme G11]
MLSIGTTNDPGESVTHKRKSIASSDDPCPPTRSEPGSPTLSDINTKQETREIIDLEQSHFKKKIKTSPSDLSTKPKAAPPNSNQTKPVVEFDKVKACFSVKQKPLELSDVSNLVKKDLVGFTEELESCSNRLDHLTEEHQKLIARLVHESDKPLLELAQYVHSKVLPQSRLEDDDGEKRLDPLPLSMLKSTISRVATRINYGFGGGEVDWIPDDLLQKKFEIWRWESKDRESVIPPELRKKYEKRWEDRQLIKAQMIDFLSHMSTAERDALLKKLSGPQKRKNKTKPTTTQDAESHPSPSQENLPTQTQRTPSTDNPDGHNQAQTEKQLAKLARDQKRKDKEDAKQAAETAKKKMGNLMTGWISKGTPTSETKTKADAAGPCPKHVRIETPSNLNIEPVSTSAQKGHGLSDFQRVFKPFNLKANVSLAPPNRFSRPEDDSKKNDIIEHLPDLTLQRSLEDFLSSIDPAYKLNSTKTIRVISTRDIVNGLTENEMSGSTEGAKKWRRLLKNRAQVPVKYLHFAEDARPGYVGTWSKTSRVVTGRTPFARDTCLLNYEYDSEAEWEEEDDMEGEDLAASDVAGEESTSELAEESDEEGWLAGDDDEIEMVDDGENHFTNRTLDAQNDDQLLTKQTKKIKGQVPRRIVGPFIPVVKGPMWERKLGVVEVPMFEPFRIQFINDARVGLNPFTFVSKTSLDINRLHSSAETESLKAQSSIKKVPPLMPITSPLNQIPTLQPLPPNDLDPNLSQPMVPKAACIPPTHTAPTSTPRRTKKPFPVELVPALVSIVNGNRKAKPLLVEDLRLAFLEHRVSKTAIEKKLSDVAVKVGGVWRVVERAQEAIVVD